MLVFCGENSIHQKRTDVLFLCNFSDVLIHSRVIDRLEINMEQQKRYEGFIRKICKRRKTNEIGVDDRVMVWEYGLKNDSHLYE